MDKHVVIVGGGIAGCMTAMKLVQRGCKVTVVERGEIASQRSGESSWAGAGILFPLLPWMYSDAVNRLTLAGAGHYSAVCSQLLDETGIDAEYQQSGMLVLPSFDMAKAQDWCEQNGIRAYITSAHVTSSPITRFSVRQHKTAANRDHAQDQVPYAHSLAQLRFNGDVLWLPGIGQVRPPNLLKALRAWLLQHGVTLRENTELKPLVDTDSLTMWQTMAGEALHADDFVVTSGAWSFELMRANAMKLNIKPMRGQILLYRLPNHELQHMVYREGFYLVPRQDGYLLAGSTLEDVGFDPSTSDSVKRELQAKAEAIFPLLKDLPVLKHWSGLRPGTPENLPVIAPHPVIEHLYLNTGHFRYGLTMAPCSADMVASLVCGEQPAQDAAPFAFPV